MTNNFISILGAEIYKTLKNPARIFNLGDRQKRLGLIRAYQPENRVRTWEAKGNFQTKVYETYEEYVRHQRSKLDRILQEGEEHWFMKEDYDGKYRAHLRERLQPHISDRGRNVLCLAARLGTEVKAFIDLGCFAIGIDLNPGPDNHYVVVGDFHHLQYANESLDMVFTNSFDHALYPEKILAEITRVLKPQGRFMADFAATNNNRGTYEALSWSETKDITNLVEGYGFKIIHQEKLTYPFPGGDFIIFEKL